MTKEMTKPQSLLLARIRAGQIYIYGHEVAVARSLVALGYVTLTDNGALVDGRNGDGERWSAELTKAGVLANIDALINEYGAECVKAGTTGRLGSEPHLRSKIELLDAIRAAVSS